VSKDEFERGKRHACSYWLDRGEDDAAEAFLLMRIEACRFGFDQRSCMAWMHMPGLMVGLRFSAETGAYETSFFRRQRR
jgi:hypothetical protein